MSRLGWWLAGLFALALTAALITGARYRAAAVRAAFVADSIEAAADTTRQERWGAERRAIQAELARDSLDKALKRSTALRGVVRIVTPPDTIRLEAPTTDSADLRFGHFDSYRPPYRIHADVSLPPPPGIGVLDLTITPDTAVIGLRVQCGEAVRGIRPATIVVSPPDWMDAYIDTAQVTPLACNEPALRKARFSFGIGVGKAAKVAILTLAVIKVADWIR